MHPQLTVSGYRGIWGDTLTKEIAELYANAFAYFVRSRGGSRILIGRDARKSGAALCDVVAETLVKNGIHVTIGGLLPTPTVLFLVREMGFDGAIIVTASHNPPEYNGLKFVTSRGMFTNEAEIAEIQELLQKHLENISFEQGSITTNLELGSKHIAHILENIDTDLIIKKHFRVVLDPINSAGAILTPQLLHALCCDVTVINAEPHGDFAHMPEPLPENLEQLGNAVKEVGADIGFAQDPDADRLVVCDEQGVVVFEEYTLSLAIQTVLQKTPGDIVINMSTSNTNEMLAKKVNKKTFRTKVGEANVVEGIIKNNAVIGGEGGGGVIYPAINNCRDSLTGIALILELLAQEEKSISEIIKTFPKFEMQKKKFPYSGELALVYEKIQKAFPGAAINTLDGLRLDMQDDSWIHIRPSNTEPVVRLIVEAVDKKRIDGIFEIITKLLE